MNNLFKMLGVLSAIFFSGVGFIFLASNVFVAGSSYKIMSTMNEFENPKDPFKGKNIKIVNHRVSGTKRFKPGYKELAQFQNINADRFVRFTATVPIRSLLKPGESLPAEETLNVYAKTRAIYYAREECKRVLEILASACEVEHVQGRIRDRMITIAGALRFVQKESLGEFDSSATLSFENFNARLVKSPIKTSLTGATRQRQKIYSKAVKECNAIKVREGNCAITRINVYDSFNSRSKEIRLTGEANYAFLSSLDT